MKALPSSYHHTLSFQTPLDHIDISSDQREARSYYEVKRLEVGVSSKQQHQLEAHVAEEEDSKVAELLRMYPLFGPNRPE